MKFIKSGVISTAPSGMMILAECPDGSIFVDVTWTNFACDIHGTRIWCSTDTAHMEPVPAGWTVEQIWAAAERGDVAANLPFLRQRAERSWEEAQTYERAEAFVRLGIKSR